MWMNSGAACCPVSQSHVCELKNWMLRQPAKIRVASNNNIFQDVKKFGKKKITFSWKTQENGFVLRCCNSKSGQWFISFQDQVSKGLVFLMYCTAKLRKYFNLPIHYSILHCVKSIRVRSYSGPYFPAFELFDIRC